MTEGCAVRPFRSVWQTFPEPRTRANLMLGHGDTEMERTVPLLWSSMSNGMYLNVYVAGEFVHGLMKGHLAMILDGPIQVAVQHQAGCLEHVRYPCQCCEFECNAAFHFLSKFTRGEWIFSNSSGYNKISSGAAFSISPKKWGRLWITDMVRGGPHLSCAAS